jgi:hypothetical protein
LAAAEADHPLQEAITTARQTTPLAPMINSAAANGVILEVRCQVIIVGDNHYRNHQFGHAFE